MFRAVPLPTVTSSPLYIWHWYIPHKFDDIYEGWNFNSGNYLFTTDTK